MFESYMAFIVAVSMTAVAAMVVAASIAAIYHLWRSYKNDL